MKVDPTRFRDLPRLTRATTQSDYSVMIDGLNAGRIMLRPKAFGHSLWFWTITGPAMVQARLSSSGEAETLEDARLGFREAFDKWLDWALAQDQPVHWFGGTT
jgi:hypothetical protein